MVLEKKNIKINCPTMAKEDIIRQMGQMFVKQGYTTPLYTEAMVEKETVFNTNIGNAIAIPHGVESARKEILKTGMILQTYPQGVDWGDGDMVKVVIAIAAVGDEHLDVLSKIAMTLSEPQEVERLLTMTEDEIYTLFAAD